MISHPRFPKTVPQNRSRDVLIHASERGTKMPRLAGEANRGGQLCRLGDRHHEKTSLAENRSGVACSVSVEYARLQRPLHAASLSGEAPPVRCEEFSGKKRNDPGLGGKPGPTWGFLRRRVWTAPSLARFAGPAKRCPREAQFTELWKFRYLWAAQILSYGTGRLTRSSPVGQWNYCPVSDIMPPSPVKGLPVGAGG